MGTRGGEEAKRHRAAFLALHPPSTPRALKLEAFFASQPCADGSMPELKDVAIDVVRAEGELLVERAAALLHLHPALPSFSMSLGGAEPLAACSGEDGA